MTHHKIFSLQRWLKLFLLVLAVAAVSWCGYFFYTTIYQTITVQGAILELEPQVGRTSLDFKQLEIIQKNLEEKKKSAPAPAPLKNPFLNDGSSPRASTEPLAPPRPKR